MKHFLQNFRGLLAHDNQSVRQRHNLFHHRALIWIWIAKYRVQRRHDRHVKAPQELQNVRACRSPKNSVFMLQANQIDVAEIQKVRSLAVRG